MKKIFLFGTLIIFISIFTFFLSAKITLAASCVTAGGHCSSNACPANQPLIPGNYTECVKPNTNNQFYDYCCKNAIQPAPAHTPTATSVPPAANTNPPASAAPAAGAASTTEFPNPLNYKTVNEVLTALLTNLRGILATIAVVFILIGGIMYMASAGNEKMMEQGKKTIAAAVIGLTLVLAAPVFLKEIMTVLGAKDVTDPAISGARTLSEVVMSVLGILLSVIGFIGIIGLLISGGIYLTAYGNEDRMEAAKKAVTASIIGIIVSLGALVIVRQVAAIFGVQ